MEYRRLTCILIFAATLFTATGLFAQSAESEKTIPLHIEATMGAGSKYKSMTPIISNVDLNYTFAKRFSLHAILNTSYFIPKNGTVTDYNRATNLGGGVGYIFLPQKQDKLGDFEIRASVTTSISGSDYKNTEYNLGIHWYGHSETHRLVPTVGIGYSFKDFSSKSISNYHGAYFTIGLRF